MSKPILLFRGPVKTRSGYGAHARDLLQALYEMDMFEIKIDSCLWGHTPMTALNKNNPFHNWIETNIVDSLNNKPDVYVQVTVPNEFNPLGNFNIGITAGIETTLAPKEWVDGCNRMDMIITTSTFSRDILKNTVYEEREPNSQVVVKQYKIDKRIEVLFEGADTETYKRLDKSNFDLSNVKEDFCFLFVGHWLKGDLGQDRKDVGMLIKCFVDAFKTEKNPPALILKTSAAYFSVSAREEMRTKILNTIYGIENPPPIYLLFGDLTDEEMNELYNHSKIKVMASISKGEGFGRPLLEFTMTGKPVIASNWSGQTDFLPMDKAIMVGGALSDVHKSAADNFVLENAKWFTANYNEFINILKIVKNDYSKMTPRSEKLMIENSEKFSMEKMKEKFKNLLGDLTFQPKFSKLVLPKLNKLDA